MRLLVLILQASTRVGTPQQRNSDANELENLNKKADYKSPIEKFGNFEDESAKKRVEIAKHVKNLCESKNKELFKEILRKSESEETFSAVMQACIQIGDYSLLYRTARPFTENKNRNVRLIVAHALLHTHSYKDGLQVLKDLNFITASQNFQRLKIEFESAKSNGEKLKKCYQKILDYEKIYDPTFGEKSLSHLFGGRLGLPCPYFKIHSVLFECVNVLINIDKSTDCFELAKLLDAEFKDNQMIKYWYILSLIYAGKSDELIDKEIARIKLRDPSFKGILDEKREKMRKELEEDEDDSKKTYPADDHKGYYEMLGVKKGAEIAEIKKAWIGLSKKYSLKKVARDSIEYKKRENKMKKINAAYEVLGNEKSKARYDAGKPEEMQFDHGHGGRSRGGSFGQFEGMEEAFQMFFGNANHQSFGGRGGGQRFTFRFG